MNPDQFSASLADDGFTEVVTVTREPNGVLGDHAHPFEARALVLSGALYLCVDGVERTYRAGEIFQLPALKSHSERYGADGVAYLVGRK